MTIPVKDWKWFGSAGHFICAQWCRFHLCTLVGEYLISTVGEYVHPRHGMGSEQKEAEWTEENFPGEDIGCDRKYETMVFETKGVCTAEDCNCGLPTIKSTELDANGYNLAGNATKGNYEMCEKWSKKDK